MPLTKLVKCNKAISRTVMPSLVKPHDRITECSGESQTGKFGIETLKEKVQNKVNL